MRAISLIFGLASVDDVLGLFFLIGYVVARVLAVLLARMVCIGIPVTAYFVRRGGESKRAYKMAGALRGGVIPLLATITSTDKRGGVGLESAPVIAFAMFFAPQLDLSLRPFGGKTPENPMRIRPAALRSSVVK